MTLRYRAGGVPKEGVVAGQDHISSVAGPFHGLVALLDASGGADGMVAGQVGACPDRVAGEELPGRRRWGR